ncbi:unnamed protein product [Triticum aestivum]|uniref:Uncharacterized protein n=3 Tax=Triticinae TaxID=1648030 RepID=A0A9R1EMR5_WHEAT|nr:putative UPF0496 protein 5 [Aegilops tauschii subsp. strangulata]XP_044327384.1 putative UPF0496 protein 5 [Triticum aestivum]KAF7013303.1 hypothetical protein CFC21_027391 [Triticum aestivum]SPT15775.1 unnamed protein product [Triticum aestivum]
MGNRHGIMRPRRLKMARATGEKLGSYEAACSADPELRSFDAALRRRASLAVSAAASGVEVRSMSLGSLREVTGCLVEMNQEVVRVVLASKHDVWGCPELFALVEDYFDASLHTLDFLAALDKALRRARDSQLVLHLALQVQDPAVRPGRVLGALRRFKEAAGGEPFTDEFFAAFQAAYRQQLGMLDRLRRQKRRLDGRLRSLRVWRRVTGVVFATTFAAILVCSVVAAAIAAPPVAAALAAAASLPVGSAGKWVDAMMKRYRDALRGHKDVVGAMQVGTFVAIEDLDSIRALVGRLEVQIGSMVDCAELAERDEEAARLAIEEVKKKLEAFMKCVDDLGQQADKCSRDIRQARTVVLQRIIHPH